VNTLYKKVSYGRHVLSLGPNLVSHCLHTCLHDSVFKSMTYTNIRIYQNELQSTQ